MPGLDDITNYFRKIPQYPTSEPSEPSRTITFCDTLKNFTTAGFPNAKNALTTELAELNGGMPNTDMTALPTLDQKNNKLPNAYEIALKKKMDKLENELNNHDIFKANPNLPTTLYSSLSLDPSNQTLLHHLYDIQQGVAAQHPHEWEPRKAYCKTLLRYLALKHQYENPLTYNQTDTAQDINTKTNVYNQKSYSNTKNLINKLSKEYKKQYKTDMHT